jgi:iron(III) transport system permease protein
VTRRSGAALVARGMLTPQVLLPGLAVLIGVALVASPFVATVARSVLAGPESALALSLRNFSVLFKDPRFHSAIVNTLVAGTGATILSCVFGLGLAWIVARTDAPGRAWFDMLNLVPFFLSPFVGAVSWIYLAAPNAGLLNHIVAAYLSGPDDFFNIYSLSGVIWVLSLFYTPYVYLFVIGPMRRMDPALEDAARVHGAGFWLTVRYVTAPLMLPALLSAALIVFVTSAGLFDVPLALASPHAIQTIPTQVFSLVQYPSDYGKAAAIGVLVMAVTVMFALVQRGYLSRRSFATVSGKGYRPRTVRLGKWWMAAMAFELFYIASGVVLPMAALILVSFSRLWTGWPDLAQFTLYNYDYILFHHDLARRALVNSLIIAVLGATIGVVLSLFQSYYLRRGKGKLRALMDALLSLPLGIPGIILGLGILILLIRTPLYGTLWIILIAYLARFFPFATRTISAMLLSISPELEESARASGATWLQTLRAVVLPLIKPAIVAAWLMLFVIFIRELGATILLYAQGTETISVAMVTMSEQNSGFVAALAVVQAGMLAVAFLLFRRTRSSILGS